MSPSRHMPPRRQLPAIFAPRDLLVIDSTKLNIDLKRDVALAKVDFSLVRRFSRMGDAGAES
jgi:hypothetical protein